jgi:hypothetical protein
MNIRKKAVVFLMLAAFVGVMTAGVVSAQTVYHWECSNCGATIETKTNNPNDTRERIPTKPGERSHSWERVKEPPKAPTRQQPRS